VLAEKEQWPKNVGVGYILAENGDAQNGNFLRDRTVHYFICI